MVRKFKTYPYLLPLSWLFAIGVRIRNLLYQKGWLRSTRFEFPVISVGNLAVGGTGKTPHIEYLIRLLQEYWQIAVLSRGYRRQSKGFVRFQPHTCVEEIGDEPYQLATKFEQIIVAVDVNRVEGVKQLLADPSTAYIDVVLLDDAYQHRCLQPGLQLLLMDFHRPVWLDFLLPAGRLREPFSARNRADIWLVTKCPPMMTEMERDTWLRKLKPMPHQAVFFTTFAYGTPYPLFETAAELQITAETQILVLTGIANPAPLHAHLRQTSPHLHVRSFADHHLFTADELKEIEVAFHALPYPRMLITTEKDAARLKQHASLSEELRTHLFVIPIEVVFLFNDAQIFNQKITTYVSKNSRNSSLSEGTHEDPA